MSRDDTTLEAATARRIRVGLVVTLCLVGIGIGAGLWLQPEEHAAARGPGRTGAPVAVRVVAARTQTLELTSRYNGELHADAAVLAARTGGVLEEVAVRIGDQVKKDQVLAKVDTAQLRRQAAEFEAQKNAAQAQEQRAAAELGAARAELERSEPLIADKLVSAQEGDALRARVASLTAEGAAARAQAQQAQARLELLKQQIRDARLVAPFDGAVAERHLDPGSVVQTGTPVLRLVRSGPLRVRFRAPERDLGQLRPELPLSLTTQATGKETFAGHVERISAAVSTEDRSVAVEGILDGEAAALRPGMYAEIEIQRGKVDNATVIPGEAVIERPNEGGGMGSGVFVVEGDKARWVALQLRGRADDLVAVDGLAPGARVVTVGQDRLRDGSAVKATGGQT